MIMTLMFVNSIMFMMTKHPLSNSLILLIQTILTSLMSGLMINNFWFSYILFLIMVGGMLILFIYMTSIASNEKFNFNMKIFLFIIMIFMFMKIITPNFKEYMIITETNIWLSLNKYLTFPNYFLLLLMIMYLFITLILVVKITNLNYGPLRQKF
uniref:NADH-ubiquinone oxidoreductase chain 6 n=1 Tax=Chaetocnema scheffleri TaxID=1425543 RepID=A0A1P8NMX0_9CUCU|nr:NADH dehydrogenase subunit 6 [Chaetocnema scheffleri]